MRTVVALDLKFGFATPDEAQKLYNETHSIKPAGERKPSVSKAEVLEEMCRSSDMVKFALRAREQGLNDAEANIMNTKVIKGILLGRTVFPVAEDANGDEITKWLKHPQINCILPNEFVMASASRTRIPVEMMERILRKLLKEDFDTYYRMAEEQIRSKILVRLHRGIQ
jgi:hypothetical protein